MLCVRVHSHEAQQAVVYSRSHLVVFLAAGIHEIRPNTIPPHLNSDMKVNLKLRQKAQIKSIWEEMGLEPELSFV